MSTIVELVTFKLADGKSEEEFLEAVRATTTFLTKQKGYKRRSLSVSDQGVWTDHVEWASLEDAKAAAALFPEQPDLMPFMTAIDPSTMAMGHSSQKHLDP